ncbi:MAG: class I SAM-dependent methyltransferase [Candidatus Obscuribacterales bacterium]|nr:class I SAM-dependent methyltransferase [Candidatus Obscuribacterales bacterium]
MNTIAPKKSNTNERITVATPQSHPDRLATIAKLFGIDAAAPKTARVLEIGCANAVNLIPAASTLPGATFVGIDQSDKQIEQGKAAAKSLGLKNLELHVVDNLQVDKTLGEFDYIIANGLFSWVSKDVQEKIFQICRDHLKPNGIAFISYNTFPGWHFRGMIRDMMLYHAGHLEPASLRATQARALIDFLAQSVPVQDNAYGIMLRNELAFLSSQPDSYLLQDLMADSNEPFYLHQFVDRANNNGLQYLGEAEFSSMLTSNFPPSVDETLRRISNEIVRTEQYMDFVRNRTFRQTLLCKADRVINRNVVYQAITQFLIASPLKPQNANVDVKSSQPETFTLPNGINIQTPHPLIKAAFLHLSEIWPQSVSFDELLTKASEKLGDGVVTDPQILDERKQLLGNDLLTAYAANTVVFRSEEAPFVTHVSDRPKASELVRLQAPVQDFITNQLHETIAVDAFSKNLLVLLNGKRDKIQILDELVELVRKGQLVVQRDGKNIADQAVLRQTIEAFMQECLNNMSKAAVLVG